MEASPVVWHGRVKADDHTGLAGRSVRVEVDGPFYGEGVVGPDDVLSEELLRGFGRELDGAMGMIMGREYSVSNPGSNVAHEAPGTTDTATGVDSWGCGGKKAVKVGLGAEWMDDLSCSSTGNSESDSESSDSSDKSAISDNSDTSDSSSNVSSDSSVSDSIDAGCSCGRESQSDDPESGSDVSFTHSADQASADLAGSAPCSLLAQAAKRGQVAVVRELLDAEEGHVDDEEGHLGWTPLFHALEHVDTAQILLNRGATPDKSDWFGRTPLSWSVLCGHFDTARLLLREGVSMTVKDKLGKTPLYWAATAGHLDCLQLLLDHGSPVDWSQLPIERCQPDVVQVLAQSMAWRRGKSLFLLCLRSTENRAEAALGSRLGDLAPLDEDMLTEASRYIAWGSDAE